MSIVSLSVCACVCMSVREDISGTTRAIFTKYLVHVAYVAQSSKGAKSAIYDCFVLVRISSHVSFFSNLQNLSKKLKVSI